VVPREKLEYLAQASLFQKGLEIAYWSLKLLMRGYVEFTLKKDLEMYMRMPMLELRRSKTKGSIL
jgi:hypothetical protein